MKKMEINYIHLAGYKVKNLSLPYNFKVLVTQAESP